MNMKFVLVKLIGVVESLRITNAQKKSLKLETIVLHSTY